VVFPRFLIGEIIVTKVLVVEDNPALQLILTRWFQDQGCTVLAADSVDSALKVLDQEERVDAVVLDGGLNGLGHGRDVAAHIVKAVWPRQEQVAAEKTSFCTLSTDPYHVDGASAVFDKYDFFDMIEACPKAAFVAWSSEMNAGPKPPTYETRVQQAFVCDQA